MTRRRAPRAWRSNRKINQAFAKVRRNSPNLSEAATQARALRKARGKGARVRRAQRVSMRRS
jgi:hypothetical protein